MEKSSPRQNPRKRSPIPWLLALLLVVVASFAAFLFFRPSPIASVAWNPPKRPANQGVLAQNGLLLKADLLGQFQGAMGLAIDSQGRIYTGTAEGKISRITVSADGKRNIEVFANTQGRPYGLAFDPRGNLIVADHKLGLLSIDPSGKVNVLFSEASSLFGIAIARDGKIYFTDATNSKNELTTELLEAKPHGRLLVYNPATKVVKVLRSNLYYPSGIAVTPSGDALLVAEKAHYRIFRYDLQSQKEASFAENLPGFIGGFHFDDRGLLWIAVTEPRSDLIDNFSANPEVKNQLAKLPVSILKGNEKGYGLVLVLDSKGQILRSLHDPTGRIHKITDTQVRGQFLYVGTEDDSGVGRLAIIP
jgi:sugar lactone lactonase YvrE